MGMINLSAYFFLVAAASACGLTPAGVDPALESTTVATSRSGQVVATLNEIADCSAATMNVLYYVEDTEKIYYCDAAATLVELPLGSDVSATIGAQGAQGAQGEAGVGYERTSLAAITASDITSIASNNTGTNAFASGTGNSAPVNKDNIVDAADFDLGDLSAATTFSQAVAGQSNNFGCFRFDLGALGDASQMLFGVAAAKVGIQASANTTLTTQWMFSPTGNANSYYIYGTDSATATAAETIIYPTATFFSRFVAFCVRGNTTRPVTVKFYQLEVRK